MRSRGKQPLFMNCQLVPFRKTFATLPTVIVTANHNPGASSTSGGVGGLVTTPKSFGGVADWGKKAVHEHDTCTTFVANVYADSFDVCTLQSADAAAAAATTIEAMASTGSGGDDDAAAAGLAQLQAQPLAWDWVAFGSGVYDDQKEEDWHYRPRSAPNVGSAVAAGGVKQPGDWDAALALNTTNPEIVIHSSGYIDAVHAAKRKHEADRLRLAPLEASMIRVGLLGQGETLAPGSAAGTPIQVDSQAALDAHAHESHDFLSARTNYGARDDHGGELGHYHGGGHYHVGSHEPEPLTLPPGAAEDFQRETGYYDAEQLGGKDYSTTPAPDTATSAAL
jgi:hypothetical protein